MRILIIEDNDDLRDELTFQLRHHGYDTQGIADSDALDSMLDTMQPNILLVDIGLPKEDGLSITRRMRERDLEIGIIILTANTQMHQRIEGHIQGADYYLCKPVDLNELFVVIQSLKRRLRNTDRPAWRLCTTQQCLASPDGVSIGLTHNEYLILQCLTQADGQHAERTALVCHLGEDPYLYDERRLETLISRLRKKIDMATQQNNPIKTWHRRGYIFQAPIDVI